MSRLNTGGSNVSKCALDRLRLLILELFNRLLLLLLLLLLLGLLASSSTELVAGSEGFKIDGGGLMTEDWVRWESGT